MSPLIFVSPLAVVAVVCLWLGWTMRIWLFVAWAAFWVAATVLFTVYLIAGASPVPVIMTLGGGMLLFQISIFGAGVLIRRARDWNKDD
ncbi:MAG: hypothetical protein ACI9PY_001958 [Ascidiaceihabitans sp.]|jgi:hypothetical protein